MISNLKILDKKDLINYLVYCIKLNKGGSDVLVFPILFLTNFIFIIAVYNNFTEYIALTYILSTICITFTLYTLNLVVSSLKLNNQFRQLKEIKNTEKCTIKKKW
jgi:hypothetical protein